MFYFAQISFAGKFTLRGLSDIIEETNQQDAESD
jgi:hypothetical protein